MKVFFKSLMLLKTILYVILSNESFVLARGGDIVSNGGGLAEKNVFIAFSRLEKSIDLCLSSVTCRLEGRQKELLLKIKTGLPQERLNLQQLQFLSEKNNPGTFIIDGEVKVAKTGNGIGSTILLNLDLLYLKNEEGVYIPMSTAEATAVLIHELGHHHDVQSHSDLDLIGTKVSNVLQQKIYSSPLLPWNQEISLVVINDAITSKFPEVFLYVGDNIVDLTKEYEKKVKCSIFTLPIPIDGIPDFDIIAKKPDASTFHNINWKDFKKNGKGGVFVVQGSLSNKCKKGTDILYRSNDYKLSIRFKAQKDKGIWLLDNESVDVNPTRDPWWKLIRLPF